MRLAQIVLTTATAYDRKCQRIDRAALSAEHEIVEGGEADAAIVYGGASISAAELPRLEIPFLATGQVTRSGWSLRKPPVPAKIVSPIPRPGTESLPEAVEDEWFEGPEWSRDLRPESTIGSIDRPGVKNLVEQTLARIGRFRQDVHWLLFSDPPDAARMRDLDLWADPAHEENDFDGHVAEAIVAGIPVVAARTPVNEIRLEQGRSGLLVKPRDPNEWTHAILSALFKTEGTDVQLRAARQTRARFRSRQRYRVLSPLIRTLTP